MKIFEKVLEKFGIFSKEFEESLDATTQEEREKYQRLWENHKKNLDQQEATKEKPVEARITEEIWAIHLNNMERFNKTQPQAPSLEGMSLYKQSSEGKKFDADKLSYTLLPFPAITEVVHTLEFGKQKYGRDNWQKVPNAKQRYLDACFRHLISYIEGESTDPESRRPHLAHAVCCLLFVLWFDLSDEI